MDAHQKGKKVYCPQGKKKIKALSHSEGRGNRRHLHGLVHLGHDVGRILLGLDAQIPPGGRRWDMEE